MHFQSKEDIFGYLGLDFFTKVLARVDAVLAHSGNPEQVLQGVFDAFDPDAAMAFLLDAEHGNELMDVKSGSSHEAIDKIATNIRLALTQWLKDEADQGRIECADPIITGQTIMSSFYGIKKPLPTYAVYKARAAQLAKMFGKGLKSMRKSGVLFPEKSPLEANLFAFKASLKSVRGAHSDQTQLAA